MLSDIEIAQGCQMRPITEVAAAAGLDADDLELYGKYKAKLSADVWTKVKDKENGKLVLVTAINPTPAGEGKTTTSVGLGQALCKQGKNAIIALREPSVRYSVSRAAQQAAVTRRSCRWRTSTCTLPAICTPSQQQTTCCAPCWTTTCSRAIC